jgi:hypothetical protein
MKHDKTRGFTLIELLVRNRHHWHLGGYPAACLGARAGSGAPRVMSK